MKTSAVGQNSVVWSKHHAVLVTVEEHAVIRIPWLAVIAMDVSLHAHPSLMQ